MTDIEIKARKRSLDIDLKRIINPKESIRLPKDLVLMKIAQRQNEIHREQMSLLENSKIAQSARAHAISLEVPPRNNGTPLMLPNIPQTARGQDQSLFENSVSARKDSYLDFLEGASAPITTRALRNTHYGDKLKQPRFSAIEKDPLYEGSVSAALVGSTAIGSSLIQKESIETGAERSLDFHITDLLQEST